MRSRLARTDAGRAVVWLLEVTWGGQVYRFGSAPFDLLLEDGTIQRVSGSLSVSGVELRGEILAASQEMQSTSVSVYWPGVAARVAQGFPLDTATATLSLVPQSLARVDRLVVLTGYVIEPAYGSDGEPVSFSVEPGDLQDRTLLPGPLQRVSLVTWLPLYDQEGETYPLVYGRPGVYTLNGTETHCPGSPARVVERVAGDAQTLLIAGHEVVATEVTVIDATGAEEVFDVVPGTDLLGQTVSLVDVSAAATIDLTSSSFWIAWHEGRAHPAVEGLGTLWLWLIRQSSVLLDERRSVPVARALDVYQVGGYLSDPCSPWDHARDLLWNLLGVSLVSGPDGVYLLRWRMDPTPQEALQRLTARVGSAPGNVSRQGRVTYHRGRQDYRSEMRLDYACPGDGDGAKRHATHSGISGADSSSPAAIRSRLWYGAQAERTSAQIVWDDSTAAALAAEWVRNRALPVLRVDYAGLAEDLAWLLPGDVVLLTDADLYWSERVAIVDGVVLGDGTGCAVSLLVPERLS